MPPAAPSSAERLHSLYSEHHGWLQRWLRVRLGNAWDAADLTQDTFLRLIRRPDEAYGSRPRALLAHIAKGLLVDRWQRQDIERAYLETLAGLPGAEQPGPEVGLAIVETLQLIDNALRQLPEQTREIFFLSQLDGLTYAAIGERLGVAEITVKRHMRNAFLACLSVSP
ncbi:MAG: putative RNA polymerase sigma factor FecI [Stenotrophomonas maltophilia]|nr:MAG: putative RNA polymerase sigma factor FecI [Stenotrophomonas maltophilia]